MVSEQPGEHQNPHAEVGLAHVGIFDFTGAFREKRLSGDAFRRHLKTEWRFIDALPYWMYDETCFAEVGFKDERVLIDPASVRAYPFEEDACLAVADYAGPSEAISPRSTLKQLVEKAAASGFVPVGGFEYETIFLDEGGSSLRANDWRSLEPSLPHNRCWSGLAPAADADFLKTVHDQLVAADITLDHHCMELGPGCVEYCLGPEPLTKASDDAALFKIFTKAIARTYGKTASFLAQLDAGYPGLGGHLSISLSGPDGTPVFYNEQNPYNLSQVAKNFLGGIVHLTPDLMCMFAPTVNAYRRLRPGNWAPRSANWGVGNYSCGVRVVSHTAKETRLEFRLPGADASAHMVSAMLLGAGLWGIENKADPGEPVTGNGRVDSSSTSAELPTSLEEAARRLAASPHAREIFGQTFVDHYTAWCRAEAAAFHAYVSAFERARYLETV